MKKPKLGSVFFIIAILLILPGVLWAADLLIEVVDADLDIPLEGATIRSWDGSEVVCDEQGRATLPLPDRSVVLQAAYPGYETRRVTLRPGTEKLRIALHLGGAGEGILENKELVLEAVRPQTSETKSGRSVGIEGRELETASQIGLVEDVMNSIKLLPGVGYTGMFNALPSIRGGYPSDMIASLDGYYVEEPYYWGGGFSIFDPRMVQSARLSHGVFSTRYGNTISGLLEVSSRKPSVLDRDYTLGISSSAFDASLSQPFGGGRGGILAMGRITYWDPYIWAAQGLSEAVNDEDISKALGAVTTAPYIRSAAVEANYRIRQDLEWNLNAFIGADGVGASYHNSYESGDSDGVEGYVDFDGDYNNLQIFLITGLTGNPLPSMVLKGTLGAGIYQDDVIGGAKNAVTARYSEEFLAKYGDSVSGETYVTPNLNADLDVRTISAGTQGRIDLDWDLGYGFLFAAGAQEKYGYYRQQQEVSLELERQLKDFPDSLKDTISTFAPGSWINDPLAAIIFPTSFNSSINSHTFNSALYGLMEYQSPGRFFGAELGLRMDHLQLIGQDFSLATSPVLNPRLNLDFNLLKNRGLLENLALTLGSGLFSSMDSGTPGITSSQGIDDWELKPNRSWTSVAGLKVDLAGGWSFNLEGYFKYIYDLTYTVTTLDLGKTDVDFRFDGQGRIFGFDLQLQKLQSRYYDGWISYTFTHARYQLPADQNRGVKLGGIYGDGLWFYPEFHRFHNLNLVLNIKPMPRFNIYTRLGLASGAPLGKPGKITVYPVMEVDAQGKPVTGKILQKYRRESVYDDDNRSTVSVPLDVKLSLFIYSRKNRWRTEVYLAGENILSLVYTAQGNTSYNTFTGKEDTGSQSASYEMPIPMVSFGVKWSY